MRPELIMYVGGMFSGKTSRLLSNLERFKYQQRKVFAFKPRVDDRYSDSEIASHMGWRYPATRVSIGAELIKELLAQFPDGVVKSDCVVAVDEAFMIPGVADELVWLFKNGITVLVSTLDLSSSCIPFEEVTRLFPYATTVHKCTAVCDVCQDDAGYTWRKPVDNETEILVGGGDIYSPRCRLHHPQMRLE